MEPEVGFEPRTYRLTTILAMRGEIAENYERLDCSDDALATMQAAIDAGYTGAPDPRCRLAEILLRAGRATEAHPIFDEVKAETPDDVWLYNNAGLEYGAAGDNERAVAWLTDGLDPALATGDPGHVAALEGAVLAGFTEMVKAVLERGLAANDPTSRCAGPASPHPGGGSGSSSQSNWVSYAAPGNMRHGHLAGPTWRCSRSGAGLIESA